MVGWVVIDKHLIYVVDDDEAVANLVFQNLKFQGHRVQVFYSGESMLAELQQGFPDLIILDIMMPGLDGVGVARQLREFSSVPILMPPECSPFESASSKDAGECPQSVL